MKQKSYILSRRIIALLILLFCFVTGVSARTVTIGTGTSTENFPYGCWDYSDGIEETIYRASEIGDAGDITSISFQVAKAYANQTTSVRIYMGHTTKTSYGSSSDRANLSDLTLVYSGSPILGQTTGWEKIMLDTPFTYNGTDNLELLICRSGRTNSNLTYYVNSPGYSCSLYYFHSSSESNTSFSTWSQRANTQFEIEESGTKTTVTSIGTGSEKSNVYPYGNASIYSTVQSLYTPSEVGGAGEITSLAFNVSNASSFTTSAVKIYLGHKSGTFNSVSDYLKSGNLTLVYSGTPTLGQTSGWESVKLTNSFYYNGTSNLVVVVCRQSSNYNTSLTYYNSSVGTKGYCLYGASDATSSYGTISNTSYSESTVRPNVKITKSVDVDAIGNGTSTSVAYPYQNGYKYSTTQILYTPTEVGGAGLISKIAYKLASTGSYTPSALNIYMGHKSSTFASKTDSVKLSDLTLVYSGTPTLGAKTGWEAIELKQKFNYNGTDNLVVVICKKASATSAATYYYSTSQGNVVLTRANSSTISYGEVTGTAAYTLSTNRPNTKITLATATSTDTKTISSQYNYSVRPYYSSSLYSTIQNIYTSSEIGSAGKIKSISYNVASTGTLTPTSLKIYMGHKSSSYFSSSSDYMSSSNLTLVYSGTPTLGQTAGWEKLTLTTPFEYNGSDNLVVVVCKSDDATSSYPKYYDNYNSSYYRGLYREGSYSDYANISSSSYSYGLSYYRPDVKFEMETTNSDKTAGSMYSTSYNYSYVAYSPYYYNMATQSLYEPTEIGGAGLISNISYYVSSSYSWQPSSLKIYMGHKSSTFSSSSDYLTTDKLTLVYSGSPSLGQATGWEKINLTTPFYYNGTDNLVVVVSTQNSSRNSSNYYYYSSMSDYNHFLYKGTSSSSSYTGYSDVSGSSYSYSTNCYRPYTKFGISNIAYAITTANGKSMVPIQSKSSEIFEDWTSTNGGTASSTSSKTYSFTSQANDVLTFDWATSSEIDCDKLNVTLDGTTIVANKSGNGTTGSISKTLTAGTHTLKASYTKDDAKNMYDDNASVKNVKLTYASAHTYFDNMTLNDASTLGLEVYAPFTATKFNYVRSFSNTAWQPLYVPFQMSYADWSANFDVAKIVGIHNYDRNDDGTIDDVVVEIAKVKSGTLKANYPYLIRAKATGSKTLALTNVTMNKTAKTSINCSTIETTYNFTGTDDQIAKDYLTSYSAKCLSNGSLVTSTSALGAFRWYMTTSDRGSSMAAAKTATFRIWDNEEEELDAPTAISDVNTEAAEVVPVAYITSDGVKHAEPQKGMNVVKFSDGSVKKMMFKK